MQLYSLFNLGFRCVWTVNVTPRPLYGRKTDPVSIVQEAGWATGPVWTGAENFPPSMEFDLRAVRDVAGHYTDYAVPAHQTWYS